MNAKKFLIGGIAGGVVYFLLGYLFYGNLFSDFFSKNGGTATGVSRAMDQFVWWALILGNIIAGCVLSYVFIKANVTTVGSGLITGLILGFLISASYDLTMYATSNIMNHKAVLADIAVFAIMSAIAGAVTGWICGRIK
ncbi:MAG TPA: hypothetical protein VG847_10960 [Chitinophagaceae bacterium]|nr:hypothetical protein [Chitinophagaceae bacterium]